MSTKVPRYLKRGSLRGKKGKLRDYLSTDMISPPLGDFRHTIHIGSGGESDMFGDVSFLQGKLHLLPRRQESRVAHRSSQYEVPFEFSRTATVTGHEQAQGDNLSPLLKNSISLPAIGGPQAVDLPPAQAPPPKPPRLHLEEKGLASPALVHSQEDTAAHKMAAELPCSLSNNRTEQLLSNPPSVPKPGPVPQNGFPEESAGDENFLSHAGSLLSLHVDLGPSILDDVLGIMDKHQGSPVRPPLHEPGRQEILT